MPPGAGRKGLDVDKDLLAALRGLDEAEAAVVMPGCQGAFESHALMVCACGQNRPFRCWPASAQYSKCTLRIWSKKVEKRPISFSPNKSQLASTMPVTLPPLSKVTLIWALAVDEV